jgi:hypothetical protein
MRVSLRGMLSGMFVSLICYPIILLWQLSQIYISEQPFLPYSILFFLILLDGSLITHSYFWSLSVSSRTYPNFRLLDPVRHLNQLSITYQQSKLFISPLSILYFLINAKFCAPWSIGLCHLTQPFTWASGPTGRREIFPAPRWHYRSEMGQYSLLYSPCLSNSPGRNLGASFALLHTR